jgi:hypothetical protein
MSNSPHIAHAELQEQSCTYKSTDSLNGNEANFTPLICPCSLLMHETSDLRVQRIHNGL